MTTARSFRFVSRRRCGLRRLIFADRAANDFAVERERLKDQVEAAVVLVREHKPDVEPEIILSFAPYDRIGTMSWRSWLSVHHVGISI